MDQDGLSKIESNPASAAVYAKLRADLDTFADYQVEVKQTSLHIVHGRAFLGVHPRKDGILLNVVTQSPLSSDRLKKSEKISANRFHNEIELRSEKDLDTEVLTWIKQAYSLTL